MIISVFKTSIKEEDLKKLSPVLNKLEGLSQWNTDLDDSDNVLRIESHTDLVEELIKTLSTHGFKCEELKAYTLN